MNHLGCSIEGLVQGLRLSVFLWECLLLDVDVSQLYCLDPVRCHMADVKHVQEETWGKLTMQVLTGCILF
jgi:hypothetical protein